MALNVKHGIAMVLSIMLLQYAQLMVHVLA